MADRLTPAQRSANMSRIRGVDTGPEIVVRKVVRRIGRRYRLYDKQLPGRPDLVFAGLRKVIFVHGCFWHRHAGCPNAATPSTRREFWIGKLEANRKRDERNLARLAEEGWDALVVWECELTDDSALERRLRDFLDKSEAL